MKQKEKAKPAAKKVEAPATPAPPKKAEAAAEKKMTGCCGPTKR